MDLERLAALGAQLGFSGSELRDWIDKERAEQRAERAAEREQSRIAAEREKEILELKLRLQEGARSNTTDDIEPIVSAPQVQLFNPQKLLPLFDERRDDLHAYLQRFERVAVGQDWPQDKWAMAVSMCLTGEALTVIGRMSAADSLDYQKVKKALLQRFKFTAQGYHQKFRKARAEDGETGRQLAARLSGYFDHWIEMASVPKTFEDLRDHVIGEQFLRCCHPKLVVFLKERECKTLDIMADATDRYLEAQNYSNIGKVPDEEKPHIKSSVSLPNKPQLRCMLCNRPGHRASDCRTSTRPVLKCNSCGKVGHKAENCRNRHQEEEQSAACSAIQAPKRADHLDWHTARSPSDSSSWAQVSKDAPQNSTGRMPIVEGFVMGKQVCVLRDTGSNVVIVRRGLVPKNCFTGQTERIVLVNGTVTQLPVARVPVDTPYFKGEVTALCMKRPLYDLVLGNIPGVRAPDDPNHDWMTSSSLELHTSQDSREQERPVNFRRCVAALAKPTEKKTPLCVPPILLCDMTKDQLAEEQQKDVSLKRLFLKVDKEFRSGKGNSYHFCEEEDILYRYYCMTSGRIFKQVVVPQKLRQSVLQIAHESIMAGHQGIRRTTDRILQDFYWPDIHGDVKRFVKSCDKCQRTTPKGKVGIAPLGNMPLITTPFERVAVDLIGPFSPTSDKGNRYVLTLIDFATRYPDAVALPAIDAVHVAEALVEMFSRIGIPKEMVTDQGATFTSELMSEVGRLLSIKLLKTSPYHAMANGLVEKFNGTLKTMLKRMCQEKPRSWDRYLAPLLFAYREVPQASLGFSPFELIYGRHVRGPLTVLKELWTNQHIDGDTRSTYTYLVELRNRLEDTCQIAHEQLARARQKQKLYYNRKSRPRKLLPGDKVLILLPTESNKLLMQWKGPYDVIDRRNDVDYIVDLGHKRKIFHINMLKKYEERNPPTIHPVSAAAELDSTSLDIETPEEDSVELPSVSLHRTQCATDVKLASSLSEVQAEEVRGLLQEFEGIFSDLPGKTTFTECALRLTSNEPIHIPQYPIPFSLRESVEKEVQEMLRMGIIEKSKSPYHAPIVVVKKPDQTLRLCIDFRELNKVLISDSEPIPRIEEVLTLVGTKTCFSKFDFTKGYWQVPMAYNSREKTAFSSMSGLYHFLYMPFGIKTAPAVFARLMRTVLGDVKNVYHYFDDVVIATDTWQEHMETLKTVFARIKRAHLTIKPSKCEIGEPSICFLGHRIGNGRVEPLLKTLDKILGAKRPTTKKVMQSFLGLTGYYRKFIPHYAEITKPLTDLIRKGQPNAISWQPVHEHAFTVLKAKLSETPILQAPDLSKTFVLRTDASTISLGAVLLQTGNNSILHPVAYASRNLLPRETRYSTIERECLALVWAVQKFHIYVYGKHFTIQSDHQPLQYLQSAKHMNNRVLRWSLFLQEYNFSIDYIKGSDNVGADYMSRV